MENNQIGRRPTWKMTKMEDDQNGGKPKSKIGWHINPKRASSYWSGIIKIKMDDGQNGREKK